MKKTITFLSTLSIAALLWGPASSAQDDQRAAELARAESFRAAFQEVVDDLNTGSVERFVNSIDRSDMLERIFGLRLIDQRIKKQFREQFEFALEPMIKGVFAAGDEPAKANLLDFASRAEFGRAVVRYDLPDFQFSYHEYDLRLNKNGRVVIVDWTDFLSGEKFSDGVGEMLIMAAPTDSAVRKLLDFKNAQPQQIFQMAQLLKAARDRDVDRYFDILEGLDENLQRQRIAVITAVHLTKIVRKRRSLRTALIKVAKYFPDEPLYSLMLLDYYFPSRQFEEALQALLRLERRLGVEDAAMKSRLSTAALVSGKVEDATKYASQAIGMEPDLELAWWSMFKASIVVSRFDIATETLATIENRFEPEFDAVLANFEKDRSLAELLASPEYKEWLASRE